MKLVSLKVIKDLDWIYTTLYYGHYVYYLSRYLFHIYEEKEINDRVQIRTHTQMYTVKTLY